MVVEPLVGAAHELSPARLRGLPVRRRRRLGALPEPGPELGEGEHVVDRRAEAVGSQVREHREPRPELVGEVGVRRRGRGQQVRADPWPVLGDQVGVLGVPAAVVLAVEGHVGDGDQVGTEDERVRQLEHDRGERREVVPLRRPGVAQVLVEDVPALEAVGGGALDLRPVGRRQRDRPGQRLGGAAAHLEHVVVDPLVDGQGLDGDGGRDQGALRVDEAEGVGGCGGRGGVVLAAYGVRLEDVLAHRCSQGGRTERPGMPWGEPSASSVVAVVPVAVVAVVVAAFRCSRWCLLPLLPPEVRVELGVGVGVGAAAAVGAAVGVELGAATGDAGHTELVRHAPPLAIWAAAPRPMANTATTTIAASPAMSRAYSTTEAPSAERRWSAQRHDVPSVGRAPASRRCPASTVGRLPLGEVNAGSGSAPGGTIPARLTALSRSVLARLLSATHYVVRATAAQIPVARTAATSPMSTDSPVPFIASTVDGHASAWEGSRTRSAR